MLARRQSTSKPIVYDQHRISDSPFPLALLRPLTSSNGNNMYIQEPSYALSSSAARTCWSNPWSLRYSNSTQSGHLLSWVGQISSTVLPSTLIVPRRELQVLDGVLVVSFPAYAPKVEHQFLSCRVDHMLFPPTTFAGGVLVHGRVG